MTAADNTTAAARHEAAPSALLRAPEAAHHKHKNGAVATISTYFTDTTHAPKSEKQILEEQRVFLGHGGKFKRWMLLPAAFLNHACLGGIYDWSVYNGPIARRMSEGGEQHVTEENVSIAFFIAVGMMGFAAFFTGPWLERHGPRIPALLGAALFMIGQGLTALACEIKSLALLYLGIGVIGGIGIGISYITAIMTLQKYFPDKRGESAAWATGGFGMGGVVGSLMQTALLETTTVTNTFLIVMAIYAVVQFPASFMFRFPPEGYVPPVDPKHPDKKPPTPTPPPATPAVHAAKHASFVKDAKSLKYILVYLVFFTCIMSGLVLMAKIADIAITIYHKSAQTAGVIVAINGFFTLAGKAGFGILSDHLGRMLCLLIAEVMQVVSLAMVLISFHVGNFGLSLAGLFMMATGFGAGFGVLPATVADNFDEENASSLYGLALTAWSIAAVAGGFLFSAVFNLEKAAGKPEAWQYDANIYWLFAIGGLGVIFASAFMVMERRAKAASQKSVA
ncbi:hypothetical protein AMAG_08883 [Allomyces macrogynus ATCC 38327]|uniref:Major facilitator superfamily (MFS) profile domain-containing protein n=1 Tax=Allomyces macrogynus (strain ATCC 38327) TaxID=578462 RepID=A0A0L0SMU9_ALLM3|nr:hypothetical protein AMAG_08883 [Allomyces macrogynus ATCC 38327]|eukprot:KNE63813.1 hypothetical protein AMAG_08883 [Allomyces macrogynus ATCC 38327]